MSFQNLNELRAQTNYQKAVSAANPRSKSDEQLMKQISKIL